MRKTMPTNKVLSKDYIKYPYNCMVRILGQKTNMSGVLISSCLVLTAAYGLIEKGEKQKNIKVIVYQPITQQFKSISVLSFQICPKFLTIQNQIENIKNQAYSLNYQQLDIQKSLQNNYSQYFEQSSKYCFAVLLLQQFVQRQSYPILSSKIVNPLQINICGSYKSQLYHQKGSCNTQIYFQHNMLADIGMGGSCIFQMRQNTCYIVGIHKGYNPNRKQKIGTKINEQIIEQINQWSFKKFQLFPASE